MGVVLDEYLEMYYIVYYTLNRDPAIKPTLNTSNPPRYRRKVAFIEIDCRRVAIELPDSIAAAAFEI